MGLNQASQASHEPHQPALLPHEQVPQSLRFKPSFLNFLRHRKLIHQMSKDSSSNHEPNHPYWQLEENIKGKPELEALLHALRASEFKYRTILEELDIGFLEVDLEGVILRVHPRFTAITGYAEGDLLGKQGDLLLDDEGKQMMSEVIEKRKQGTASSYELPVRHRLGHRIWLLITGAPLRDMDGDVVGSVGIHFDVTARKELELENERALANEAMARQRERELLMKMSHEIRTPINAINGLFHLLDTRAWSEEEMQLWQGAQNASAMLRTVVDDILHLTKLESGANVVSKTEVNVVEVTAGLAKMHHLLAEQKGLTLTCSCRLLEKNRRIDVDKWLQILTNLLGNAIKYTPEGEVTLDIFENANRPGWICAEVRDSGPGIDEAERDKIFAPFGGRGVDQASDMGSTGLGLTISRELAVLMGGDLLLMPSPNGARFLVELPAETWGDEQASSSESAPVPQVLAWDGSGVRVLMAEDNELNIMYAQALFDRWNLACVVVGNGREALEAWEKGGFDVLLLDVQMPEMDGLEALTRLRGLERDRDLEPTPVYMVTAFADEKTRSMAMERGATGFVSKPFSPQEMHRILTVHEKKEG